MRKILSSLSAGILSVHSTESHIAPRGPVAVRARTCLKARVRTLGIKNYQMGRGIISWPPFLFALDPQVNFIWHADKARELLFAPDPEIPEI